MKRFNSKKLLLLLTLLLVPALLLGCTAQSPNATAVPSSDAAQSTAAEPTATPQAVTLKVFDAEELAKYDGQNGNSAYIAVSGKVYDVTDVPQWKDGSHFGRFQAGVDLTDEITNLSPHGIGKLDSVPIVGLYEP